MIRKFKDFLSENSNSEVLLYYAFDWDDNILNMPTMIRLERKQGDSWIPTDVSTAEFAEVRSDKDNWKLLNDNPADAFANFRDNGPLGDEVFLEDVKTAISANRFGPAWQDFIECLSNGSLFAIITARGHESETMRKGVEWIIDNVLTEDQIFNLYNNLLKFAYYYDISTERDRILKGIPSQNELVNLYLDSCDFIGVSAPSRGGTPDNPEKAKEEALLSFQTKVNRMAGQLGMKAMIGFSDDDLGNVAHIEALADTLNHEEFPNIIKFVVKGTKDPENITRKVTMMNLPESESGILSETSHQSPGMESSVLPFTQFGNMTSRLNPKGPMNRQDDFFNRFVQQTNYLAKTSKELRKDKKRKSSN
jgi:hypothetical protein